MDWYYVIPLEFETITTGPQEARPSALEANSPEQAAKILLDKGATKVIVLPGTHHAST